MSDSNEFSSKSGGKFDFKDGGTYIGEWCDGRAHGFGIATGPNNQGEYSGDWSVGFENCGVYIWPSGNVYEGLWMKGKRHGEGVQVMGRWVYKGCFTTGFFGRYGVKSSLYTQSRYEGCWHLNEFDGYGIETCADGSTYAGMWFKNQRKGLGVSHSAQFGLANDFRDSRDSRPSMSDMSMHFVDCRESSNSIYKDCLTNEIRNGFVLCFHSGKYKLKQHEFMDIGNVFNLKKSFHKNQTFQKSDQQCTPADPKSFKLHKKLMLRLRRKKPFFDQRSSRSLSRQRTNDNNDSEFLRNPSGSLKSTNSREHPNQAASTLPTSSGSSLGKAGSNSFSSVVPGYDILASIPKDTVETYAGQWNANTRTGLGVGERSDGLKYIGEWLNNKRHGYGITCYPDNTVEEGRYKDNILVQQLNRKSRIFLVKHSRLKNLVDDFVQKAIDVAQDAKIKAVETAYQRAQTALAAAISAQARADDARKMSKCAREIAKQIAPNFEQPGPVWELKRKKDEAASRSAIALARFQVQSPISSLSFDSGSKTFETYCDQTIIPPKSQKLYKPIQTPTRSRRYQTLFKSKSITNDNEFSSESDVQNTFSQQPSSEFSRRPNTRWFVGSQESPYLDVMWSSQKKCSPIDQSPPSMKSIDKCIKVEEANILEVPPKKSKPKLKSFKTQVVIRPQEMTATSKSSHQDSGYYSMEPESAQLSSTSASGFMSLPISSFTTSQKQETHCKVFSRNSPIKSLNLDHFDQYSITSNSNQNNRQRISLLTMNRGSSMDENILVSRNLKTTKKNLSHDNSFESEVSDIIFSTDHKPFNNHNKIDKLEMLEDIKSLDEKRSNFEIKLDFSNYTENTSLEFQHDNDLKKEEEYSLSRNQLRSSKRRNPALARSPPAFTHDDESENFLNQKNYPLSITRESQSSSSPINSNTSISVSRQRSRIPISKFCFIKSPIQTKDSNSHFDKSQDTYQRFLPLKSEKNEIPTELTIYDLFSLILSAWTQYWMLKFRFSVISSLFAAIKMWLEENLSIFIVILINILLVLIFLHILLTKTDKEE